MKKLSKLVALLLAGAMAMLLLTACSGGGTSGEDTNAENAVINQLGAKGNNADLRKTAEEKLNESFIDVGFGNYFFNGKVDVDGVNPAKEYIVVTVTAKYDYANTGLEKLLKKMQDKIGSTGSSGVNVSQANSWTNVGVVVKNIQGQSYLAISVQVKNPKYKNNK